MSNVKLVITSELENTKSIAARLRETIDNLKQNMETHRICLSKKNKKSAK